MFSKSFFSKRHLFVFFLSFFSLVGIFFATSLVFAQEGDTFGLGKVGSNLPLGGEDIRVIIAKIIRVVLSLLGIIAVGLMLYAGFTWMTSGGSEDKIAEAKKILINATIGLAIIMASFAITQFVLKSLQSATGGLVDDDASDRVPVACANFADCNGGANGPKECGDEGFVVKSLTPKTPQNTGTGMTNVIVRAVFSRPLDAGQNMRDVLTVKKDNNAIAPKNVRILDNRYIVEAVFDNNTVLCQGNANDKGCLTEGNYVVEVNPNLEITTAPDVKLKLQTRLSCGEFDNKASFVVNKDFLDIIKPQVTTFSLNGKNAVERQNLSRGKKYRVSASFNDRVTGEAGNVFGGMSYLDFRVQSEPQDPAAGRTDWHYYTGPKSSSNDSFSFNQELNFGVDFSVPTLYNLTLTSGDIDGNKTVATSSFVLDGELCHNGRQDAGETGVDIGGACLGDGQCTADWQCISGECVDGRCINKPVIRDIDVGGRDPGSWDAAPGSWVTINGNFFGEQPGSVDFGFDADEDGVLEDNEWRNAPLANCNGLNVWTDRMVIVSVPDIRNGASTTVRIRTKAVDAIPSEEDLSTDDRGPKPGPYAGIFQISQNEHPGLCGVFGPNNARLASSTVPVTAFGINLGDESGSITFGGVVATIKNWNDNTIGTVVPQNMQPGRVGVRAQVGELFTNAVEFTIAAQDENLIPRIESISPTPTTTLGSLMTVYGGPFGSFGTVYFAPTKEAVLTCARTNDANVAAACTKLELNSLPALCGNTWGNTQIIGKIPLGIPLGQYFIALKNEAGYTTNGETTITLVDGAAKPGLCKLEPNNGVSPLRAGDRPLTLVGVNLFNPELFFWTVGSNEGQFNTWLDSVNDMDPTNRRVIRNVANNGTTIQTVLPQDRATGLSMSTGPIKARVNNEFSNSVRYSVNDCNLGGNPPGPNYQCCTAEGPEKGQWKPQEFACLGESKSAGYIWRFTTGLIPHVPRVLEACQREDGSDLSVETFVRPSPSPWKEWNVGNACTDSVITLQFSMYMAPGNLAQNIRVYKCGTGETPDCEYNAANNATALYNPRLLAGQEDILELKPVQVGATHATNTWYRVVLGTELRANQGGLVQFGESATNTRGLAKQRTLDERVDNLDVAYYFDFKTGSELCNLFGAAITPANYTTRLLGVIQSPNYPISTNFDDPAFPLYYHVWGRGEQECSVVDVNGKGWQWKPRFNQGQDIGSNFAYSQVRDNINVAVTSSEYYKDVRATVNALQNTLLTPVYITASTNTVVDGVQKPVVGTSTLYIDLGDPEAIEWWPQCNESCINATVGVKFNRPMVTSTYRELGQSAIQIQKCRGIGENCVALDAPTSTSDVNVGAFDPFEYSVTVNGDLELGALYQVSVSPQIKSLGRYVNGIPIHGKALVPKVWKFRTKMQDGVCILDKVDVVPNPFISRVVGQKTPYAASPLSSPDQCSPMGQRLNPWGYGWNWSTASTSIATVSHLQSKGNPPRFCTAACLPGGSDIPRGQVDYLCGNGEIDPGEDCDIADNSLIATGEIIGQSCTLNCLRPGNENTVTTTPNSCGNGVLEPSFGEECDLGISAMKEYCTETCNWKGSSQEFSSVSSSLQCGNGLVGLLPDGLGLLGEDCDLGLSLKAAADDGNINRAAIGCSSQCLHLGTTLSREYCESTQNEDVKNSPECRNSITICGNSRIEPGEECEIKDATHIWVIDPNTNNPTEIVVNSAISTCGQRCILKNICEVRATIHPDYSCERGTVGCADDCTKLGSSPFYETPSLCGDGEEDLGENPRCEDEDLADDVAIGDNPVQIVTSIGNGTVNPITLRQETVIQAQVTGVRSVGTTTLEAGSIGPRGLPNQAISGQAQYALQCGYVEYEEPSLEGDILRFNNCPNNLLGVGANSCCQERPSRLSSYPVHGAGIIGVEANKKVCLNTYIEATFNREIDELTLQDNLIIASLHPAGFDCASSTQRDVTGGVNRLLGLDVAGANENIFVRAWEAIKEFFATLFSYVVHAAAPENLRIEILNRVANNKVWCTGKIVPQTTVTSELGDDGLTATSSVGIYINDILATNTLYAVILEGGKNGIQDIRGVGIRGEAVFNERNAFKRDNIFVFETGDQICKIESVKVDPESKLFSAPNTNFEFKAEAVTAEGAPIVTTPPYAWEWSWQPVSNTLFTFVTSAVSSEVEIRSKTVEGHLVASAQALVTRDVSQNNNHQGKIFAGLTDLTAFFCENPWPSRTSYPYEDKHGNDDFYSTTTHSFSGQSISPINLSPDNLGVYLNFGFGYCADNGAQADVTDDLPLLESIVEGNFTKAGTCSSNRTKSCFSNSQCANQNDICIFNVDENNKPNPLPAGTLKKFLFFNKLNDDIIGVQVFSNPDRLTSREWYIAQNFSGVDNYTQVTIDGYDAISDGNNFYVNALNELEDGRVHNYIYLFGINPDAQANTRKVFEKIVNSLTFNLNITERNTCYTNGSAPGQWLPARYKVAAVTNMACTTDYDCRNPDGSVTSTTNGVCSNAKTKFQRDWTRLTLVKGLQYSLEEYKKKNNVYPDLAAGTYIPGYTNAHWPSWNRLLEAVDKAVPTDPINEWSRCFGVCEQKVAGQVVRCSTQADCVGQNDRCILPDDTATCWSSSALSFVCPLKSNVLEYKASSTVDYKLFLPLEYFNYTAGAAQRQIIDEFVSSTHYSSVQYCGSLQGAPVVTAQAGACGNGIKNAGEDCDPPGTVVLREDQACVEENQSAFSVCNASCRFDPPVCRATENCGNGRVEADEDCDEGDANGTYGRCTDQCELPVQYCGNRVVDMQNGTALEFCDKADPQFTRFGFCRNNPANMLCDSDEDCGDSDTCVSIGDPTYHIRPTYLNALIGVTTQFSCSNDCQGTGDYCGDGKLQLEHEACDDGNTARMDGCSEYCQIENLSCPAALPNTKFSEINGNTVITLAYNANTPEQCLESTGSAICNGVGLDCRSVKLFQEPLVAPCLPGQDCDAPEGEFVVPQDWLFINPCLQTLRSNIGKDVQIECTGLRAQAAGADSDIAATCGNGRKEDGEVCDTGDANGILCNPQYDTSCTYCAANCKEVLTRDPIDRCGNGKIDLDSRIPQGNLVRPQNEVCDIDPATNGVVVLDETRLAARINGLNPSDRDAFRNAYNSITKAAQCTDKGTYSCENKCQVFVDNCVNCGLENNVGKAIPKVSILNVLTPSSTRFNSDWAGATQRKLFKDVTPTEADYLCGIDGGWVNSDSANPAIVYKVTNDRAICNGEATKSKAECLSGHKRYSHGVNQSNYSSPQWICQGDNHPKDRGFGYEVITNINAGGFNPDDQNTWVWGNYTETVTGIETSPLCRESYGFYFNEYKLRSHPLAALWPENASGTRQSSVTAQQIYGSFFPYPVDGEQRTVENTLVVSPAVPPGTFRVVLKWTAPEGAWASLVQFTGLVYNQDFLDVPEEEKAESTNAERLGASVSYLKAKTLALQNPGQKWLCDEMRLVGDGIESYEPKYWFPTTACKKFFQRELTVDETSFHDRVGEWPMTAFDGRVYIHEMGAVGKTRAQATTIVTGFDTPTFDSPYAFFVQPIIGTSSLPISVLNDLDLTVEIYDYRNNQIGHLSMYMPKEQFVYHLNNADASGNDIGIVKYWHVFNLFRDNITGRYEVRQVRDSETSRESRHGRTVTDFAEVLCGVSSPGVPSEPCNRDEGF